MGNLKKAAAHVRAVLKGMLFIGFSVQILLGLAWICCNMGHIQSFGEPDSALYRAIWGLYGGRAWLLYLTQLAAAFLAGFLFLQGLGPARGWLAVWRGLALLTMPFALQCHLALQPYSLMGSLFLLMLFCLLRVRRGRAAALLLASLACMAAMTALSGVADADRRALPGYSIEGAMASRFAWPKLWNDIGYYGAEVADAAGDVAWEASYSPDNMALFQETLERRVGSSEARALYLHMARVSWDLHASVVIRQIGWDLLGYLVAPAVFPLQMAGRGYDSYSGRNYEIMREKSPVLTKYYVDYGCWWFKCALVLGVILAPLELGGRGGRKARKGFRGRLPASVGICALCSGILAAALTMRGAGRMDYRCTIGVCGLWIAGVLLLMGGKRRERK